MQGGGESSGQWATSTPIEIILANSPFFTSYSKLSRAFGPKLSYFLNLPLYGSGGTLS
jgi:hypothetical protein